MNLTIIRKIIVDKYIAGMPNIKIKEVKVCGGSKVGKQTNMAHKKG